MSQGLSLARGERSPPHALSHAQPTHPPARPRPRSRPTYTTTHPPTPPCEVNPTSPPLTDPLPSWRVEDFSQSFVADMRALLPPDEVAIYYVAEAHAVR